MTDGSGPILPARIWRNDWTRLHPPALGSDFAALQVSVVIPHYNAEEELNRTLAALSEQTYPDELIEVIVVDDGSPELPALDPALGDLKVKLFQQADKGFGLARARNRGAAEASGDLLLFLDCDMIPEPQWMEAHARWHHAAADVITIGNRWHVDFDGVDVESVRMAARTTGIKSLVEGRDITRPEWIERWLATTIALTRQGGRAWRIASGGNLGISREVYLAIGGTSEVFQQWGGEDNEFAFRAIQYGGLMVPEPAATAWHQGAGAMPDLEEAESLRLQRPLIQDLIADRTFRKPKPGRTYAVPYFTVTVDCHGADAETVIATTNSVLANTFHDLRVRIDCSVHPDREFIERTFRGDPRVNARASASEDRTFSPSPVRINVPAGVLFHAATLLAIADEMDDQEWGLLRITVPSQSPGERTVDVHLARAYRRARRIGQLSGEDVGLLVREMHGEHWAAAMTYGLGWSGGEEETVKPHRPGETAGARRKRARTRREVIRLEAQLARLKNRRSVRLSNAAGELMRSRSVTDFRNAVRSLGAALHKAGPEAEKPSKSH